MKEKPTPKWREHAELLLLKASQDEYVLDKLLNDSQAPSEIFGFHAQQSAEKLLKAALVVSAIEYPQTHRLAELIDLLTPGTLPKSFDGLIELTPFAVEFRYGAIPEESETPLNKKQVRDLITSLRAWVGSQLQRAARDKKDDAP